MGNNKFNGKQQTSKKKFNNNGSDNRKPRYENNRSQNEAEDFSEGLVVGRNAVRELLKSGRAIDKLLVQKGEREGSIVVLVAEAIERHIPVVESDKAKLDKLTNGASHQGIVAMAAEKEYCSVDDILNIAKERGEKPFIVIADGVSDPHNLGALFQGFECFFNLGITLHCLILLFNLHCDESSSISADNLHHLVKFRKCFFRYPECSLFCHFFILLYPYNCDNIIIHYPLIFVKCFFKISVASRARGSPHAKRGNP